MDRMQARKSFELGRGAVAIASVLALCLASTACITPRGRTDTKEPRSFTVTKKAYVHIAKTGQHLEEKDYTEALEELEDMRARKYLSDHERALMWQMFSMTYALQEEFEKSTESLAASLKLDALPEQTRRDMERNLAQAYLVIGKFSESARMMTMWLDEEKEPAPEDYYILATAHAQAAAYADALPWALKAVDKMKETREPWLQLLLSLHFELKQEAKVATLLQRLVELYPDNKTYWMQLAAALADTGDDSRALAVMELIYAQDMLTESPELLNLAKMYLGQAVPIKTVRLIEKEFETKRIDRNSDALLVLADALLLANEERRALVLLHEAAELSTGPSLHVHIARVYLENEEWTEARKALLSALSRADGKEGAEAYLLLGMVEHNTERPGAALIAFRKAAEYTTTRKSANQWLANLGAEPLADDPSVVGTPTPTNFDTPGGK